MAYPNMVNEGPYAEKLDRMLEDLADLLDGADMHDVCLVLGAALAGVINQVSTEDRMEYLRDSMIQFNLRANGTKIAIKGRMEK